MKDFEYIAPQTLREAVAILTAKGDQARAMAGGTDLIVQMRVKRHQPACVVDIKNIPELNALSYGPRRGMTIGAATPCSKIYADGDVVQRYPGIVDSASIIGGIQIQGRASLGGNLCNASPSADTTPLLIAYGASCEIAGPNGRRQLPIEEFCTGPGSNALQAGELLVSIQIPPARKGTGAHYQRFIPRNEMDIAVVGVGSYVALANRGKEFKEARVALGAVGPTPIFVQEVSQLLVGKEVNDENIAAAAAAAQAAAKPISDMRGTAEYRTHLVGVLTKRTLAGAILRAKGKFVANAIQEAAG